MWSFRIPISISLELSDKLAFIIFAIIIYYFIWINLSQKVLL